MAYNVFECSSKEGGISQEGVILLGLIWLIVFIVSVVIDVATSGFLFIGVGIGALFAMAAGALGASILIQCIICIIVSALVIVFGYPKAKALMRKTIPEDKGISERYVGTDIRMEEDMDCGSEAKVKVGGIYWTAKNEGELPLKAGDMATVVQVIGNKVIVKHKES